MKILIGMPCIHEIPTRTVISLLQVKKKDVDPYLVSGSLIYDSRDYIAHFAVDNDYDYVLYVDSDMIFDADDMDRLLSHNVGICSGLYVTRDGTNKHVAYTKVTKRRRFPYRAPKLTPDGETKGFGEIAACGFGFCLIKTSVLKTMFKYYKSLFEPKSGLGEDIIFCVRARQVGFKTFIDREVKVGHIGEKVYGA